MSPNTPSGLLTAELQAEVVLNRAVRFCADRMYATPNRVLRRLQLGEPEPHSTLRYAVAKGIGEYLKDLGCGFRAVYLYGSAMNGDAGICSDIDLIVVVEHKLDQVSNLLQRLDLALVVSYRTLLRSARGPTALLDVHIVDVEQERRSDGYGAVLCSPETSPVCLWRSSPEASGAPVSQGPPSVSSVHG